MERRVSVCGARILGRDETYAYIFFSCNLVISMGIWFSWYNIPLASLLILERSGVRFAISPQLFATNLLDFDACFIMSSSSFFNHCDTVWVVPALA